MKLKLQKIPNLTNKIYYALIVTVLLWFLNLLLVCFNIVET